MNSGVKVTNKKLIEWVFYTESFLKCVNKFLDYFHDVKLVEYFDNSFKLEIRKNSDGRRNPTNGFLFSFIEDIKIECNVSEYSISQTSLEQIFNNFAKEVGEEVLERDNKKEMKFSKEILQSFKIR
jgi:hypothetical protein